MNRRPLPAAASHCGRILLVIALAMSLACALSSCGGLDQAQLALQHQAEKATLEVVGPEWTTYVTADASKSAELRASDLRALEDWRAQLDDHLVQTAPEASATWQTVGLGWLAYVEADPARAPAAKQRRRDLAEEWRLRVVQKQEVGQ